MGLVTGLMAAATLGSAAIGASSSRKAASAQAAAANDQIGLAREQFDQTREDLQPFRQAGGNALAAFNYEMGLGDQPDFWQGMSMTPGSQFAMQQGRDQMEAGAAARGGLFSGATLGGLERLRFGMAAQDRDSQLGRLAGMVDMGQGAAAQQAQASNAFVGAASNALANRGDAQAAGAIGVGNAFSGAMNNMVSILGYHNALNRPTTQGLGNRAYSPPPPNPMRGVWQ